MFGYVVPLTCELKVREYETFRAYYCGLCKALSKNYHKSAVLSYDCVFLYLLTDSLHTAETTAEKCSCALHPLQHRKKICGEGADFAADINVLMAYSKILDDARDGGKQKWLKPFFKKSYQKAEKRQPRLTELTKQMANELHKIEDRKSGSTDEAAHTYANLLGKVLEDADVVQSHILYELGYHMGRWVYLIDALDDVQKDAESGNYNVLIEKYGGADKMNKKEIEQSLYRSLAAAAAALNRLELKKNKEILQNIIYLGLREQTQRVLSGKQPIIMKSNGESE